MAPKSHSRRSRLYVCLPAYFGTPCLGVHTQLVWNSVPGWIMSALAGNIHTICCLSLHSNPSRRLISASVGTIVYYGFQCNPHIGQIFLVCCLLTGIAGNILPFMDWFNTYEYRVSLSLFKAAVAHLTLCRCGG